MDIFYILILVIYAGIIGSVTPYVIGKSEHYGALVPSGLALTTGSAVWALLTWFGFPQNEGWIWTLVMLAMPAAVWVGSKLLDRARIKADEEYLIALKTGGVSARSESTRTESTSTESAPAASSSQA